MKLSTKPRCAWAQNDPLEQAYHDKEWGRPLHDDRRLFELLILEGAQAGLSWSTILRKRDAYRKAFAGFDPRRVARFDARKIRQLLGDPGIVRNEMKIRSAIANARAVLAIQKTHGSFDAFVWTVVGGRPRINHRRGRGDLPARTTQSDELSRMLKDAGCSFVGSTICYAFMQAAGLVNDHVMSCYLRRSA